MTEIFSKLKVCKKYGCHKKYKIFMNFKINVIGYFFALYFSLMNINNDHCWQFICKKMTDLYRSQYFRSTWRNYNHNYLQEEKENKKMTGRRRKKNSND